MRGLGDGAPVLAVHAREARGGAAAAGGAGERQAAGDAAGPRHQAQEDPQRGRAGQGAVRDRAVQGD